MFHVLVLGCMLLATLAMKWNQGECAPSGQGVLMYRGGCPRRAVAVALSPSETPVEGNGMQQMLAQAQAQVALCEIV